MRRVLSVQDLSCMGKCSLTVALPVLSAMGCACTVLPTAVLSTHTAFPNPHCLSLTGEMVAMAEHWKSVGAEFDAITVGYLADPEQAGEVSRVVELFDAPVILDPVMGDHGRLYSRVTDKHVAAMKTLCRQAKVLLPNVTEAAYLTGLPYRETPDEGYLSELTAGMLTFGADAVVITGFLWDERTTGFAGFSKKEGRFSYRANRIPRSLHGTGDLFAATFTGSLLRGKSTFAAAKVAAGFVERVVAATDTASPFGAEFEKELPWLISQL